MRARAFVPLGEFGYGKIHRHLIAIREMCHAGTTARCRPPVFLIMPITLQTQKLGLGGKATDARLRGLE